MIFVWLTSCSRIISRSIHVVANGSISFFFYSWVVFHRVCVPHLFHSSADGHLVCSHVLAIVNSTAVNTGHVHAFESWFSLNIYPWVGLLDHIVVFLVFRENFILFSIVSVPIYIPINSVGGFPPLHTLSRIYCLWIFWWWPFWLVWDDILS